MLVNNTVLIEYPIRGVYILVKREDLSCPYPGPSFSKMRGVMAHIANRPETVIGCLDTSHSKAGWAVAYACKELGKQAINFWPLYKGQTEKKYQQLQSFKLGATLVELKAGRSAILYHRAKKIMAEQYPGSYLMPNALKLPESITENAAEAARTLPQLPPSGTLIISISSGTVAAGVLKGLAPILDTYDVILHMGYSRSISATSQYIERVSGMKLPKHTLIIDEGYSYADAAYGIAAPFPCNPYYDLKAWKWLSKYIQILDVRPIVFWNIGE